MMVPAVPAAHAPGVADHALIVLMALVSLAEAWWYWPRIMRALADRVPGTRRRAYRNLIVLEWAFAAAVVASWVAQHRTWAALHVGLGRPVATALGAVFVVSYLALVLIRVRALLADPERVVRFAARQTKTDPWAPRTTGEQRLFAVVAVTAGLCEEFFYRGFALWYFTQLAGPVAGFALAAMLFGLSHLYLGRVHVVRTAILGAVFGLLVISTGSLWLAIVLHAAMDLVGAAFGSRAFRAAEQHASAAATLPALYARPAGRPGSQRWFAGGEKSAGARKSRSWFRARISRSSLSERGGCGPRPTNGPGYAMRCRLSAGHVGRRGPGRDP